MKILFSVLCLMGLLALGLTQSEGGLHKKTTSGKSVASGPVTQTEAREVFLKIERAFKTVAHITGTPPAIKIPASKSPVTRDQTVIEMGRLFDYIRPYFTLKLKPMPVDTSIFTLKDPAAKAQGEKLAAWGCVARFGPLVAGKGESMDIDLFGDSIGFFIGRISELTHTPSSRFSPYLNGAERG